MFLYLLFKNALVMSI